ncbi:hypothetical protein CTEN210_02848 [Chaetoceros tenuissimus]|uniref:RING-type domain-containing protein n=1 Tax=Chaetoceros tenuissimus TaxID=426638 RepID=A0AAD3CIP6_9STRA|nr:hypothetical protein CTEN210_02848 [Chaetoceros tenuissimus]
MSETQNSNVLREGEDASESNEDVNPVEDAVEGELENTATGVANGAEDEEESEIKLDENRLKTWNNLISACYDQQWDVFEQFLSDENTSIDDKREILHFKHNSCRNIPIDRGGPLTVIKALVDIEGVDVAIPTISNKDECSWLHQALRHKGTPIEVIQFYVDIGGKKLLLMQSDYHFGRSALHIAVSVYKTQEVIDILLRVGGLEILDITDYGGFQVIDYCDKAERELIINSLRSMQSNSNPSMHKYLEQFEASTITPKEVENWIHKGQLDHLRDYLSNDKISEREKRRCFNYKEPLEGRNLLHLYCSHCYPVDITRLILELMDEDYAFHLDGRGNTYLHLACKGDFDTQNRREVVKFLIDHIGVELIHEVNCDNETALHELICCPTVKFDRDLIKMMTNLGGEDLLYVQNCMGFSVLHYLSMYELAEEEPDRELLIYFISKGGTKLCDLTDYSGKKAEDYWTDDIKDYIQLSTGDLPSLSDDTQCPICFNAMTDVLMITRCFHRFCRKCITECYHQNGNNCPICRIDFSIKDLRHDPLLTRLVEVAKREKDAKDLLQEEVQPLRKKLKMDSEPKQS